ncbi:stomatin family protein [Halteromyces radiatus]|uniref:stomatin family protein n=1 Tax=Halteromyces radiatus TaxID=101107 RepID=UPI00221FB79D|nr:stomatin family protein [Halteromyces radiatus]KAI8092704.1 stomatin family protein [Halteromyces radiatus]
MSTAPVSAASNTSKAPMISRNPPHKFAGNYNLDVVDHGWYGSMLNSFGAIVGTLGSIPLCFCFPNPYKSIDQGYVGLVTRYGSFTKAVDPGLVKINPFTEHVHKVDIRVQVDQIPKQIIMTKDNVNVQIDSVLYWSIVDPYQSAFGVSDVHRALIERTQTTLRHVLGAKVLQDCIENREAIAMEIQNVTAPIAKQWGVKIESILIKDLNFSKDLQESLSSAAQAQRVGRSKVIAAKAEVDSAKLMRETADILSTESAQQIRYLETMKALAKSPNTRVIFLPHNPSDKNPTDPSNSSNLLYANLAQIK